MTSPAAPRTFTTDRLAPRIERGGGGGSGRRLPARRGACDFPPRHETRRPRRGEYEISDKPHKNTVHLDLPVFEGFVERHLALELLGVELDTFDPDDKLPPYRRVFTGPPESWVGAFGPGDEEIEPEDLGDWRVWYRVERG